jgi:taurine dioxygenase
MALQWKSIQPFGAEVEADFTKPLSDEDQKELLDLFGREHLLVVRQELEMDDQRRLTKYFGPLLEGDVEMVSNDPTIGLFGSQRLAYHSDLSFVPEPILVGLLYGLDLVPGASSTHFASGAVAYGKLSTEVQDRIAGLKTLHVFPNDQTRRNRLDSIRETDPRFEHPLVQHDKRTGEPFLYLCEMQIDSLVGLPEDESEALIKDLLGLMHSDECVYRHNWDLHDLVIWDNLSVQHGRPDVADVGKRTLRRSSAARIGFLEQAPQFGYDPETGIVKAMS